MLKKEDGLLDFTQPASALERRVRAMNPWPGAFFEFHGNPLKVHRARTASPSQVKSNGTHAIQDGMPCIHCGDNSLLVLDEVQPAGKKSMPGKAFLAGMHDWIITNDHE